MAARLIVLTGPTASGKTGLSLELAKELDAEIFSADARQFYRGLDIGTAKPTKAEQAAIKHHFIDTLEPTKDYSAGQYAEDLNKALKQYFQEKETAIVVGGSGFYIKAAIEGLDDLPKVDSATRDRYNKRFEVEGIEGLQKELEVKDPVYFKQVDIQNRQRVQRALEAIDASGVPFSELRIGKQQAAPWSVTSIALEWDRPKLYERIDQRVDQMMEDGLLEEARRLYPLRSANALQTVGYKELFTYLDEEWELETAVGKIKQHTRNYAKRQTTWFRKQNIDHRVADATLKSIMRHL